MQKGSSTNRCVGCNGALMVYDTRTHPLGRMRRRRCLTCGKRFSTVEIPMEAVREVERVAGLLAGLGAMAVEAQASVQTLSKWRVPKDNGLASEMSEESASEGLAE